jgi:pyrimidine operon attenuation protein/uracil phosphoribosyltransferase
MPELSAVIPTVIPDAEALLTELITQMQDRVDPARTALVGIHTGGVWIAERLREALQLTQPLGAIDVAFYRDDYSQRGLQANTKTSQIPFVVEGAHIIIVDDVLYTGRTIRAAITELFDYGRPAKIELAVLVDRGGRELPVAASFCPLMLPLPATQSLALDRNGHGSLSFCLIDK